MIIELNGEPHECPDATTVAALIVTLTGSSRGSAVVLDGEIVPRSTWDTTPVSAGQRVELITAVQGG